MRADGLARKGLPRRVLQLQTGRASTRAHKAGCEAKFWLAPIQLSWNKGFREADLREIVRILLDHETELLEAWNETE